HSCVSAPIKKPRWRCVINAHNVQAGLSHECQIQIDLLGPSEIGPFRVRFERTVGDTFDEEFLVTLQKEFRRWANSLSCHRCHVERSRDITQYLMRFNQEILRLRSE